jgi:hypothetical protein
MRRLPDIRRPEDSPAVLGIIMRVAYPKGCQASHRREVGMDMEARKVAAGDSRNYVSTRCWVA